MHKHTLVAASALAALCTVSIAARADDANRPLTRDEVVAQTLQARQTGELSVLMNGGAWTPATSESRPLTREEVVASVLKARETGELSALENGGTWSPAQEESHVSRDAVVQQFQSAHAGPSDALAMERSL